MKRLLMIIFIFGCVACVREGDRSYTCQHTWKLDMLPVPYVLEQVDTVGYKPYYEFVNTLDILCFQEGKIVDKATFDYEYCRNTPVIVFQNDVAQPAFLLVANLLDPKAMSWTFDNGRLGAEFTILNHREPSVYLAAVAYGKEESEIPVQLNMLVAHLVVEVVNPQSWMKDVVIRVENVVGKITTNYQYRDTTYIEKSAPLNEDGINSTVGINTFPTYPGHSAQLSISFRGDKATANYVIANNQVYFTPHGVIYVRIVFEDVNSIKVFMTVNGKWQIIDEGHIVI